MARKILCVAEKPSIARALSQHLAGGQIQGLSVRGSNFTKNFNLHFNFNPPWGPCDVTVTSLAGHLSGLEFHEDYRQWRSCRPSQLFEAPIREVIADDKKPIAENIRQQARYAYALFVWTDCDLEGEAIGAEIRDLARQSNAAIQVKRATFSNTERSHMLQAAQRPNDIDERQVNAVKARSELDLRIGAAFTRFTTHLLQNLLKTEQEENGRIISYGSCQFPTLGFVVDRYFKVRNFKPEPFWSLKLIHARDDVNVNFSWRRNHLFDRAAVVVLFQRCLDAKFAKVNKVQTKPTSKYRPLPLTTVELQKLGSTFLRMSSSKVMSVAEKLYQKGWISYPRTETDQFDPNIDLKQLVQRQTQDEAWGPFAQALLDGQFKTPRKGRHNDKAHPPIHPVNYVAGRMLDNDEKRVYEFVVRRFLACCAEDAKGETSVVEVSLDTEEFKASGLTVLQRNYLDVYPYEKWTSSQPLPRFNLHEVFEPTEMYLAENHTTKPNYLTEPELIGLMDANGIGTDATMAEHIQKIQDREYVSTIGGNLDPNRDANAAGSARRGQGGRGAATSGRGGRQTAASTGSSTGSVQTFIPTSLGVALIKGYDDIDFEPSLSKPFLRKQMEMKMREICAGTKSPREFVQETVDQYREVYVKAEQQQQKLIAAVRQYVLNAGVPNT